MFRCFRDHGIKPARIASAVIRGNRDERIATVVGLGSEVRVAKDAFQTHLNLVVVVVVATQPESSNPVDFLVRCEYLAGGGQPESVGEKEQ